MLTIRKEQTETFSNNAQKNFECRMVTHLKRVFPDQCSAMEDAGIRQIIQTGIEKAAKYGVQAEYDVARYIDLMFVFGIEFDKSPEYPWASRILTSREYSGPTERMNALYDEALAHARKQMEQIR